MIKILLFSTLYPSSARPNHGIFVETRLRHLLASGEVEARVLAPVPWFPSRRGMFGEYARFASTPKHELWNGIQVDHPRYVLLPKIDMNRAPHALAKIGLRAARQLIADGHDFDLIDAHYYYPDGVAATMIGRELGKPVVITARGTDINLIPHYPKPRKMILDAVRDSAATITVSAALKQAIVSLGGTAEKITVLRNGVDLELFFPEDRDEARSKLGLTRFAIASVGNLIESKGHHLVIEAMRALPDAELLIAGGGSDAIRLRRLADDIGVGARVRLLGSLPQKQLRTLYSAVDCLVLASAREGWPNVLLEAMACGTPVVASNVGGVAEIVSCAEAGRLMQARESVNVAESVLAMQQSMPDRASTRAFASAFDWHATTRGQIAIFSEVLARGTCANA